jgi:hypothetical protein
VKLATGLTNGWLPRNERPPFAAVNLIAAGLSRLKKRYCSFRAAIIGIMVIPQLYDRLRPELS